MSNCNRKETAFYKELVYEVKMKNVELESIKLKEVELEIELKDIKMEEINRKVSHKLSIYFLLLFLSNISSNIILLIQYTCISQILDISNE